LNGVLHDHHLYLLVVPVADRNHARALRNSLSRERILQQALTLVDELGPNGLSTRALGRRLGLDSTAPSTGTSAAAATVPLHA
jgi:hypothetical protein